MGPDIVVTKHGEERLRERLNLNKSCGKNGTFKKICRRALEAGHISQDTADEIRAVYNNVQLIFAKERNGAVLVLKTVIPSCANNFKYHRRGIIKKVETRKDFRLSA